MQKNALTEAAVVYLGDFSVEKNLRKRTVENKRGQMRRFLSWLGDREFTLENLREYIKYCSESGYQPSSIKTEIKHLRSFSNFLCKRKYITENIAKELVMIRVPKKKMNLVSAEIAEKIIFAGTEPTPEGIKGDNSINRKRKAEHRIALRFILRTGLRVSECINLKGFEFNLDDESPTFWVESKGGDQDILPVPSDLVDELRPRIKNTRMFAITEKTCNQSLKRGAEKLSITTPITVHTLRHIFCTSNLKAGVPLQQVSRLMRHSSVTITDETYSHYNTEDLAMIMNNQSLVKKNLSPQAIFENIEKAIRHTDIEKDARFQTEIVRNGEEIMIKVTLAKPLISRELFN